MGDIAWQAGKAYREIIYETAGGIAKILSLIHISRGIFMSEKSIPPVTSEINGMMRSLTTEFTMAVNAVPMTTATARSMTLP